MVAFAIEQSVLLREQLKRSLPSSFFVPAGETEFMFPYRSLDQRHWNPTQRHRDSDSSCRPSVDKRAGDVLVRHRSGRLDKGTRRGVLSNPFGNGDNIDTHVATAANKRT